MTDSLTTTKALELVCEFFVEEWPTTKVEDVHLRPITGGFCHRLNLLTRTTPSKSEPSQILIRHFGRQGLVAEPAEGSNSNTTLSAAEQGLIYHEMGKRGWGPKIYGLFRGGRLEEWIDSHPLTAIECSDAGAGGTGKGIRMRRDVARCYAQLHSLELPFRKGNFIKVLDDFKNLTMGSSIDKISLGLEKMHLTRAKEFAGILRNTDWNREFTWVGGLFERYHCKRTIAIGDANYLNILVKDYPSHDRDNDDDDRCQTMLIDYETATYSYRGIDIGGHFNERMYAWNDPDSPFTGYEIPDIDERREFCHSYLCEMRALGQETTEYDTVDHLILESEIGQLYQLLFSVFMSLDIDGLGDLEDATLLTGLIHMLETYLHLKSVSVLDHHPVDT